MKSLKKYFTQRNKELLYLLENKKRGTKNNIHKIRVEIKKINSLFHLLEFCSNDFNRKSSFKPYKKIFQMAGKIRDIQLEEDLLKKKDALNDYFKVLKEQKHSYQISFNLIVQKQVKKIMSVDQETDYFSLADSKKISRYIKSMQIQLEHIFHQSHLQSSQIHSLRKVLKEIGYNAEGLNLRRGETLSNDKLTTLIGKWHDNLILTGQLNLALSDRDLEPTEKPKIENLIERLSMENTALLEQIEEIIQTMKISK